MARMSSTRCSPSDDTRATDGTTVSQEPASGRLDRYVGNTVDRPDLVGEGGHGVGVRTLGVGSGKDDGELLALVAVEVGGECLGDPAGASLDSGSDW